MAPSTKSTHFLDARSVPYNISFYIVAKAESLPCSDPVISHWIPVHSPSRTQTFESSMIFITVKQFRCHTQHTPFPILWKLLAPLRTNTNCSMQAPPFCLSASLLSLRKDILLGHHSFIAFLWRREAHIYFSKSVILITRIALSPCFIVLAAFISLLLCIGLVKAIRIPHPFVSCWCSSTFIYLNINCSQ